MINYVGNLLILQTTRESIDTKNPSTGPAVLSPCRRQIRHHEGEGEEGEAEEEPQRAPDGAHVRRGGQDERLCPDPD